MFIIIIQFWKTLMWLQRPKFLTPTCKFSTFAMNIFPAFLRFPKENKFGLFHRFPCIIPGVWNLSLWKMQMLISQIHRMLILKGIFIFSSVFHRHWCIDCTPRKWIRRFVAQSSRPWGSSRPITRGGPHTFNNFYCPGIDQSECTLDTNMTAHP